MSTASKFKTKKLIVISFMAGLLLWVASFTVNDKLQLCSNVYLWWALVVLGVYGTFAILQYRCPACGVFPESRSGSAGLVPSDCGGCGAAFK